MEALNAPLAPFECYEFVKEVKSFRLSTWLSPLRRYSHRNGKKWHSLANNRCGGSESSVTEGLNGPPAPIVCWGLIKGAEGFM